MQSLRVTPFARGCAAALLLFAAACVDQHPTAARTVEDVPESALQVLDCTASVVARTVSCESDVPASAGSRTVIGGQNDYVVLTASNITNVGGLFEFDVTVQNLLNEAIGTPDGTTVDPAGIMVFFSTNPAVTAGPGSAILANQDGTAEFTGENQSYYAYVGTEPLRKDAVSASKRWQIAYDPGALQIKFQVYVSAMVQPMLVINEVMVNPLGAAATPSIDTDREWFEVYNAGRLPVDMQGMVIADSAGSGRRPYKLVDTPLLIAPGGYAVLGMSANPALNGGEVVDFAYGASLSLVNSLDAVKIARVVGNDTLTIDRTQYASAAVSAKAGISRELKNPALDNSNMDGSNWDDASVTAVYGSGGRGTPRAQNSVYTP